MGKRKLAPHEKVKKVRRAQSAGVDGRTDYAADAGVPVRDVTRVGATAAGSDMMDRAPRDLYELAARLITEVDQVNKINFRLIRWYGSRILMQFQLSRARYDLHLIRRVIDRVDRRPMRRPDLNGAMPFELAPLERELARARSAYADGWRRLNADRDYVLEWTRNRGAGRMRRMIERAQADVDDEIDRRRNLGILERFWGSDQPPSLRAYAIDPANKNRNTSSQENAARQFALDTQADAASRTGAHNRGGYQRGQAGSSNGHAAERIQTRAVEENVYPRAYIEDVRRIAREVEREDRGYRKLSKRDRNVIALNDALRAGNYERADEIQRRMDRDTERNREKRQRHAANKQRFRAEEEERRQGRVPYLRESDCSDEELEHEGEDRRGDDDEYRGPGTDGNGANGRGGAGGAAQAVRV